MRSSRGSLAVLEAADRQLVLGRLGSAAAQDDKGNGTDDGERAEDGADGDAGLGTSLEAAGRGSGRRSTRGGGAEVVGGDVEAGYLKVEVRIFNKGLD